MDYILEFSKIKLITCMNKYIYKCENLNNYIDIILDFIKKYNKISIKDIIHENNINFNVNFNIAMLSQLLFVKCEKFEPIAICSVQEHEIISSRFYKIVSYGIDDITHKIYKYLTFFKIDNDGNFYDIYRQLNPNELTKILLKHYNLNLNNIYDIDYTHEKIFKYNSNLISWDKSEQIKYLYYLPNNKFETIIEFLKLSNNNSILVQYPNTFYITKPHLCKLLESAKFITYSQNQLKYKMILDKQNLKSF